MEILKLFTAGAAGALIKEILDDGALQIPFRKDGKLYLGFLSSIIIGGFVGYVKDGGIMSAMMGGFIGFSIIGNLISASNVQASSVTPDIETTIRLVAKNAGVDPDLAMRVAKAESALNPDAVNVNKDGSRDRGIFQINDKWHPEVTDGQAFDPVWSTQFFCTAFKAGHLDWWNASKANWDK